MSIEKKIELFNAEIAGSKNSKKDNTKRFLSFEEGIEVIKEELQELIKERDMTLDFSDKKKK